jgi:hypothetical protein
MGPVRAQLDRNTIQNVIQILEHVCLRLGMYIGDPDSGSAIHFLTGFRVSLDAAFDLSKLQEYRSTVLEDRGYRNRTQWYHEPFVSQVRERSGNERDAAVEFVRIELEAWKQLLGSMQSCESK